MWETESRGHNREVQESKTDVVGSRREARPRIRRMKDSEDGNTWEKKKRKTEAEMDGLCQPRHESHLNDERWSPWQNWLEENCVCRSNPTTKWERLEEEERLDNCPSPRQFALGSVGGGLLFKSRWHASFHLVFGHPLFLFTGTRSRADQ